MNLVIQLRVRVSISRVRWVKNVRSQPDSQCHGLGADPLNLVGIFQLNRAPVVRVITVKIGGQFLPVTGFRDCLIQKRKDTIMDVHIKGALVSFLGGLQQGTATVRQSATDSLRKILLGESARPFRDGTKHQSTDSVRPSTSAILNFAREPMKASSLDRLHVGRPVHIAMLCIVPCIVVPCLFLHLECHTVQPRSMTFHPFRRNAEDSSILLTLIVCGLLEQ